MEGGYLLSSVLVQGLYQLICSAALPQNLSGSATEAAKWVLYSPPLQVARALQPRAPRPATKALRAALAPLAEGDPGRGAPSVPAPVTLRHCSQDGFILPLSTQLQARELAVNKAGTQPLRGACRRRGLSPKRTPSPEVWKSNWSPREKPTWIHQECNRLERRPGKKGQDATEVEFRHPLNSTLVRIFNPWQGVSCPLAERLRTQVPEHS